jgi:hypothetical protein
MVISETDKFAQNIVAPLFEIGDTQGSLIFLLLIFSTNNAYQKGCTYIDQHTVKTPKGYKEAYQQYCEGGWQGLGYPVDIGGQGMPQSMTLFHSEILVLPKLLTALFF